MNISYKKAFASAAMVVGLVCGSVLVPSVAFAQVVPAVSVPAPQGGQVQGMVSSIGNKFITIDNVSVDVDGDTVFTYNNGATALTVGQLVNYTYTVDVDGVKLATAMDVYPTAPVSGTARVSRLDVINATGEVSLGLFDGRTVHYFQPYAFISDIGTNTSYGNQLVTYEGFLNPVTGKIMATYGYMSPVPVYYVDALPAATVGESYNAYAINIHPYGMGDLFSMTATGLPEGMTNNRGVISGVPTTAGTYTINFTATGGWTVGYANLGDGSVTLVVNDTAPIVTPPATTTPVLVSCDATGVVMNYGTSRTLLDVSVDGAAPVKVAFATQANTLFVAPLTTFVDGAIVSYTGTYDASGTICNADMMIVESAQIVDTTAPTITLTGANPVALTVGDVYVDAGATCVDDVDGTCSVTTTSLPVDTTTVGSYVVTYAATDLAGNTATISRDVVVSAPVLVACSATGVVMNYGTSRTLLDVSVDGAAPVKVAFATQANTTFVAPLTNFVDGAIVTYTGSLDASGVICNADTMTVEAAPVVVIPAPVVNTGKKVEDHHVIITSINDKTVTVGTVVLNLDSKTVIKLQNKKRPLAVGMMIEYKGTLNSDGTVKTTSIKAQ